MSGFLKPYPDLRNPSGDGRNFILLGPLVYIRENGDYLIAIPGTTTDGLSVPDIVCNIIKQNGILWLGGVIHDAAYRNCLVKLVNGKIVVMSLTRQERDELLLEMIKVLGAPDVEQQIIYDALRLFGEKALDDDIVMPIPHIDEISLINSLPKNN